MGILESLVSAEWVKGQLETNAFELVIWTLVIFALGVVVGYKAGQWRTRNKEAEAKFALLDKYIEENKQLSQDLRIANHKLNKTLALNTALSTKQAEYEARYTERMLVEHEMRERWMKGEQP